MARGRDWLLGILLLAALGLFIFFVASLFFGSSGGGFEFTSGKRIGLVEIKGVILDAEPVVKELERFGDAGGIVAVIVRIDSPGGGVAASQEIYEAVKRVRDKGKFVIASMASVAASGGYYVACGADTIMANPGTITGSIGVIAQMINMTDLLEKIGIDFEVVKSGKYKDSGLPYRPMTADDRRYLQENVDNAFQQFVAVVAKERQLDSTKVLQYADGRAFTGQQALNLGLIDMLGTYQDAVRLAARLTGITGKAKVVRPRKRKVTIWDLLFGDLEQFLVRYQTLPVLRYQLVF